MKLLLDSSTNYLYLGIVDNDKIYTFTRSGKNDHSETLVDFLGAFLKEHNYTVDDIKEIYIGRGPGSYTGLRIAGTVGKVLADIKNIDFYSFSSLDFVLASRMNENGNFIARIDAKKNHSYYKVAKISDGKVETLEDDCFGENTEFEKYPTFTVIEPDESLTAYAETIMKNLISYNMFKKEDKLEYSPNYIRSGI